MKKSPAFQFYATDYLGSQRVQMLTLEEEGAYIRLLCYCWQHGSIPSKHSEIARLVGKGCSTNLARVVSEMFDKHPNDQFKMIHSRLESEKNKQAAWREKCSVGGAKSAESKKLAHTVLQLPLTLPLQGSFNIPSPSPSSVSILQKKAVVAKESPQTPDEIISELKSNPAYSQIDVGREFHKMSAWCSVKRKTPSKARLINWLNRVEQPIAASKSRHTHILEAV